LKEDHQITVKLLEQLNSNLNFLRENPKGDQIEQLRERLALIDQCIDQALLLISLVDLEGSRLVKQRVH